MAEEKYEGKNRYTKYQIKFLFNGEKGRCLKRNWEDTQKIGFYHIFPEEA